MFWVVYEKFCWRRCHARCDKMERDDQKQVFSFLGRLSFESHLDGAEVLTTSYLEACHMALCYLLVSYTL